MMVNSAEIGRAKQPWHLPDWRGLYSTNKSWGRATNLDLPWGFLDRWIKFQFVWYKQEIYTLLAKKAKWST